MLCILNVSVFKTVLFWFWRNLARVPFFVLICCSVVVLVYTVELALFISHLPLELNLTWGYNTLCM